MSRYFGAAASDALMANWQCGETDAKYWFIRACRRDMSYWKRNESQFGARYNWATLWTTSGFMSGDRSSGYCHLGQDMCDTDTWSPMQRANRGNGATKFIRGVCKDSLGNTVSGAIVQGFITSNDQYVGETTCDGSGNYELGTPYPATSHYLVAYRAGSPDISGTTVNTLQPTNRDGT